MEQIRSYADPRQVASCIYCGGPAETRDHVPSRVLLAEPYPENLPVVPACHRCNSSFSKDEEYLACLLECVASGSANSQKLSRGKAARILDAKPALAARLEAARREAGGRTAFQVEADRVTRTVLKLARGHAAFELNAPQFGQPDSVAFVPLLMMSQAEIERFLTPPSFSIWPEVGSRAMSRAMLHHEVEREIASPWIVVQPGRYRYLASTPQEGIIVRLVLHEYLACEVLWT